MLNKPSKDSEEKVSNLSASPIGEQLRNCNLSFSFNFDFDDVNSDASSDSESANLQIDVSEVDNYEPSTKRKRESVEEASSVFDDMEEEIERQLDAKAAKTNLTATNVKNILKHVITNEHVMAMVQKRLSDKEDDIVFEPKLTRAKAKELAATQGNIPWPITPVKKSTSEVQALIEDELPEDSSDEEYNPEQDKQSDDEKEVENCATSDAEVQAIPLVNNSTSTTVKQHKSTGVQYDPEGIFKDASTPCAPIEEDSIGHRTRSKLCLSETPLEQIEQAFVPPDITTDMYDWDGEVDEDWDNFLKEFTRPLTQEPTGEDDPEADPEYNILEDEETDFFDKEELRADKAVKITRKELNNLIAELFEFTDSFSKEQQESSKKKKAAENVQCAAENTHLNYTITSIPISTDLEIPKLMNLEQKQILAIQMCQHTQLLAQHFIMTYMHPHLHSQADTCKRYLITLRNLNNGPDSAFNVKNLPDALQMISDWEHKFLDEKFQRNFTHEVTVANYTGVWSVTRMKRFSIIHPEIQRLFFESKALMMPQLLPQVGFKRFPCSSRFPYTRSEEHLIALGLEQFIPFTATRSKKFKGRKIHLVDAAQLISQYLLPSRDGRAIMFHIHRCRCSKDPNPIKHYFKKGSAPAIVHCLPVEYKLKALKEQPIELFPPIWRTYISILKSNQNLECKPLLNLYKSLGTMSMNHPFRNVIVNAVPKLTITNKIPVRPAPSSNVTRQNVNLNKNSQQNIKKVPQNISANVQSSNVACSNGTGTLPELQTSNVENAFPQSSKTTSQPEKILVSSARISESKETNQELDEQQNWKINAEQKDIVQDLDKPTSLPLDSVKMDESLESLEKLECRQLRRSTPRLAKTKSAQNMKLMAQVLGPKGVSSSCNNVKSREKLDIEKISKESNTSKVDDEEEIAELMLASTTIKKDSVSRRTAKKARVLENIKRLLDSENPSSEEEREAKFAASFFQKLHVTLEPQDSETLKAVMNLYIEYTGRFDSMNQAESSSSKQNENKDALVVDLYQKVCNKLQMYPELCSDFLLFLSPEQAALIDKTVEYSMLQRMSTFVNVAQIYFAKQPSRIAKMMQAITQLSSDSRTTLETILSVITPILKGHPLIMDLFLQVLPTAKPPESLFAPCLFENLICPLGPHEKSKAYAEDALELYENIDLPVLATQDDPYGGENCKCDCHNPDTIRNNDSSSQKSTVEHCISCGIRYLNGRLYFQTTEGLRPAKVIFPGAEEDKLENIARVSLKTTDKFVAPTVPKRRRRSSKNDSNQDDVCQKTLPPKNSPIKETENQEKTVVKQKKNIKTPSFKSTDDKKPVKRLLNNDEENANVKRMRVTQQKSKREKKAGSPERLERSETSSNEIGTKLEKNKTAETDVSNATESNCSESDVEESSENNLGRVQCIETNREVASQQRSSSPKKSETTKSSNESNNSNNKPWTRQEDAILLQSIKKEYSENSLILVSNTLGNRTLSQVKERCQTLLSLLEKMA